MPAAHAEYDPFASEYAAMVAQREAAGVHSDPVVPPMLAAIGPVAGLGVLDAGCGEGYLARLLAERGARVTGVDLSPRLIALAQSRPSPQDVDITYIVADLSLPQPDLADTFDLVASHFVLNDVEDYQGFLATVAACVKPGGRLVFSLNNPYSFVIRGHLTDYFATDRPYPYRGMAQRGVPISFYHQTLEQYLDACFAVGLTLRKLVDVPTPEGSFMRQSGNLLPVGVHFPFFTILTLSRT